MNRSASLLALVVAIAGAAGARAQDVSPANVSPARPNVLFIVVDDLNDWLGCLGGHPQAQTPNIDRLARRGVLFTEAHCVAPLCGPSRAAVFSGLRPESSGLYANGENIRSLRTDLVTIPQYFSAHGYHSVGGGKLFHGDSGVYREAFDEYGPGCVKYSPFTDEEIKATRGRPGPWTIDRGPGGLCATLPLSGMPNDRKPGTLDSFDWGPLDCDDDDMSDGVLANWATEQLSKDHGRPLFLGVGFFRVHQPLYAPRKYFQMYPPETVELPEVAAADLDDLSVIGRDFAVRAVTSGLHSTVLQHNQWEKAVSSYLACITFVDAMIGRVLDALDAGPAADNTVIVLWTDHGWHLGEKQHWGKWTGWHRSTHVPLIIAPARSRPPSGFVPGTKCHRAVSLLDLYPTLVELSGVQPKKGLQGQSLVPLLANPGARWDRPAVTTFGRGNHTVSTPRWQYVHYFDGTEELYDLSNDPHQWNNLGSDAGYVEIKRRLAQWLPENPGVAHFVRMGDFKAVIPADGSKPLLFTGLSDRPNLADKHPQVLERIVAHLKENRIKSKHVIIPEGAGRRRPG